MLLLFNQIIKSCLKEKVISKCRQLFGSARAERATDRQRETERHKQRQTDRDRQRQTDSQFLDSQFLDYLKKFALR